MSCGKALIYAVRLAMISECKVLLAAQGKRKKVVLNSCRWLWPTEYGVAHGMS
jgi:hypothetical protein